MAILSQNGKMHKPLQDKQDGIIRVDKEFTDAESSIHIGLPSANTRMC